MRENIVINELIEMLKRDEGTGPIENGRFLPYRCSAGYMTIGYGRNIEERGISSDEAELLLSDDVASVIKECHQFDWYAALDEVRQVVVCNMVYNIGINRFKGFKKTIGYIKHKKYDEAAIEMLDSKWASQVGPRATRLSNMMKTGEFE